jgi:hypothetical protein
MIGRMPARTLQTTLAGAALLLAACTDRPDRAAGGSSALAAPAEAATASLVLPLEADAVVRDGVTIAPKPDFSRAAFSRSGWATDFTRRTVPFSEIQSGGPPKDGIPAIDAPRFAPIAEGAKFLVRDEPVMVVAHGNEVAVYPLQILIWHEIVNDTIGGEPIVVTYCPLCNTAIAFRRTLGGAVLDFGTTGNLRRSDMVMYDRQTESWWQQITGEGIVGKHAGARLEFVPASILAYSDAAAAHPSARVLTQETGHSRRYGQNPYVEYDSGTPFLFSGPGDARLLANERVLAVSAGGEAVAYPFAILGRERVVNDQVGGTPLLVLFKPGTRSALDAENLSESRDVGSAVAFSRSLEGRVLTFEASGEHAVDRETRSRWDITGRAVSGPLAGRQLTPVVHGNHFWFAWAVFQPDSRVYQGR